ncbi:ricin-type beta-trefoil lectin domain protein [Streptomyces anandii]|uniref:ricin-type beta-trefoil lectin domain protein n=1 Tax=Streptomyces anandii TaxID=285454 RepID=UPI003794BC1C
MTTGPSPWVPHGDTSAVGKDDGPEGQRTVPGSDLTDERTASTVYRPAASATVDERWIAAFEESDGEPGVQAGGRGESAGAGGTAPSTPRAPGPSRSAARSRVRVAVLIGVCAAVVSGAVLAFGEADPKTEAAPPANIERSPVGLPILNDSGNVPSGPASAHPRATAGTASPSTRRTPTKQAVSVTKTAHAPQQVTYAGAASALCMDASSATAMRLNLAGCDGRATERFTYRDTHQLQAAGNLCATAQGGSRGALVVLAQCSGDQTQRWILGDDGSIRQGSLCLDALNGGTQAGTLIQLWDCSGSSNQTWRAVAPTH